MALGPRIRMKIPFLDMLVVCAIGVVSGVYIFKPMYVDLSSPPSFSLSPLIIFQGSKFETTRETSARKRPTVAKREARRLSEEQPEYRVVSTVLFIFLALRRGEEKKKERENRSR